jgi:hypothetical protein
MSVTIDSRGDLPARLLPSRRAGHGEHRRGVGPLTQSAPSESKHQLICRTGRTRAAIRR